MVAPASLFKLCFNSPVNDIQIESKCDFVITPHIQYSTMIIAHRESVFHIEYMMMRNWENERGYNIQFILEMAFAKDQFKASWYFSFAWKWEKSNNFRTIEFMSFSLHIHITHAYARRHNRVELLNEKKENKRDREEEEANKKGMMDFKVLLLLLCWETYRAIHPIRHHHHHHVYFAFRFPLNTFISFSIFSQHFQHVIHHNFLFSRVSSRIFFSSYAYTHLYTRAHTQSVFYTGLKMFIVM